MSANCQDSFNSEATVFSCQSGSDLRLYRIKLKGLWREHQRMLSFKTRSKNPCLRQRGTSSPTPDTPWTGIKVQTHVLGKKPSSAAPQTLTLDFPRCHWAVKRRYKSSSDSELTVTKPSLSPRMVPSQMLIIALGPSEMDKRWWLKAGKALIRARDVCRFPPRK